MARGGALLDNIPEMVTISDRLGRITYANPATERVSGYTPEEFASLHPTKRIHPDDLSRCEEAFGELLHTPGLSLELEHRAKHKDGTWRWVEVTLQSLFDDPEVGGLLATVRETTERKRTEAALRDSEERQAFLLHLSDKLRPLTDPVAIESLASRLLVEYLGANRAMYLEFEGSDEESVAVIRGQYARGVPLFPERVPYADFADGFPAELLNAHETLVVADTARDERLGDNVRNAWLGTNMAAAIATSLIKNGRMVANFGLHNAVARQWTVAETRLVEEVADRTWEAVERGRAEDALRASEERYRTLFDLIDEGFCTIEIILDEQDEPADFRILQANPAFEQQTGLENATGLTMRELVPDLEEFWFEVYGRIARTGEAMRFEHEAAALGRYYDVYAFRVDEPEKNRVAVIFKDVLARKRAEEEQEWLRSLEASARAEAAERERIGRELHDRVAHTMAVAHQSLQLHGALADRDPVRAAETLKRAAEATRTALDQTRRLSSQLARQNTEETRYGLSAALRGLLETHLPEGVEADLSVSGDEQVVSPRAAEEAYLVMREAVRNAVAHSGCRRIDVGLEIDDAELKGHVRDDGTGFDRLESPNRVRGGREDGYAEGVGLRSMKERTGQLGGRLEVHSEPGVGTTVEVRVPLVG